MFGERNPSEEYTPKQWGALFLSRHTARAHNIRPFDGQYRRVPATDNVAIAKDMRVTAQVFVTGEPVDAEARRLIEIQDAEALKQKRNPKEDYTIVYIPPNFKYRVAAFITALWVIGAVSVAAGCVVPVVVGRELFRFLYVGKGSGKEVHDGYSFVLGFYFLWANMFVMQLMKRVQRHRKQRLRMASTRSSNSPSPASWPLFLLKRSFLWMFKISYMVLVLGVIVPILLALVIELYIVLPIRFAIDPALGLAGSATGVVQAEVPRIRVVQMWAMGIVYAKIGLRAWRRRRANLIAEGRGGEGMTRVWIGLREVCISFCSCSLP